MDQCTHCAVRGDIGKCRVTDCNHHENWYAVEQSAELSRLRELVRDMREALDTAETDLLMCERLFCADICRNAITKADAILNKNGEPVRYGCYAIGLPPLERCRYEYGNPCVHSPTQEKCEFWRPIK